MNNKTLMANLRCIPDFPQKGINFRDVTTLFKNPACLQIMEKLNKLEEDNKVIISDRSFYSSLVYQEPREWIQELNKYAKIPDLVLLLDLDVEKSVARTDGTDEFENVEFLTAVKENYLKIAEENGNFKIIDANNGPNKVSSDIKKAVAPLFDICADCIR